MAAARGQRYQNIVLPDQFYIITRIFSNGLILMYEVPGGFYIEITQSQLDAGYRLIDSIPENRLEASILALSSVTTNNSVFTTLLTAYPIGGSLAGKWRVLQAHAN